MTEDVTKLSDEELVQIVGEKVIGTPSGLEAQHAQAELNRRLINSINSFNKSTATYSEKLIDLTLILFAVALLQVTISVWSFSEDWITRILLSGIILLFFLFMARLEFKRDKSE